MKRLTDYPASVQADAATASSEELEAAAELLDQAEERAFVGSWADNVRGFAKHTCPRCGAVNAIVNACRCDPNNLPTPRPVPGDVVNVTRSEWYGLDDGEALQLCEGWPWLEDHASSAIPVKGLHGGRSFWGRRTGNAGDTSPETMETSGGPFVSFDTSLLRWTGTTERTFWRWKDVPRADGSEHYTRTVNVWTLDLLLDPSDTSGAADHRAAVAKEPGDGKDGAA